MFVIDSDEHFQFLTEELKKLYSATELDELDQSYQFILKLIDDAFWTNKNTIIHRGQEEWKNSSR